MLKRKVSVAKQHPSMPRIISKLSNLSQRNFFNVEMPKTRFNQNDRSISSPRIKSFPAEIIRRIEPSPVRNSSENIVTPQNYPAGNSVIPSNPTMNFGQGDTIPDISYNQLSRSIAMPNQNASTSDHEVSRNICPMENQPIQSDPMIVPRTMENPSMERPQHRPFVVPNSSPIASNLVGNSPRKFHVQRGQVTMPEVSRKTDNETTQFQDPWKIENDSVRRQSDGEPIDESSKLYSSNVTSEPIKIMHQEYPRLPRGLSMTNPNISNVRHSVDRQNSSQIHPTLGHDHSNYWNEDNCQRRQFSRSNSGMTSPQDIAINQTKNHQRFVHFGNVVRSPNADNNANLSIVNDNPPLYYNNVPNGTHEMANQYSPENWQTQRQHYNNRDQSFPQKQRESMVQPKLNDQSKSEGKRKSLRFSPSMIRDQEMLVMTMRQQGISEDIMRRQFDALLAEQRKQLLYLEQLENRDTKEKSQESRTVQRKISRIEEDGKPEWMLHITPPRIPYSVIEKMQSECQIVSPVRQNSDGVETVAVNQSDGNHQFHHHESHDNNQRSWQHQLPRTNNRQPQDSYVCNNVTNEGQNYPNPNAADHYQQRCYGYPVYNQPQSHQHHCNQHVAQKHWESRDQHQKNQLYEEQAKNVKQNEASSLLKLRVYKDVIKRQKQNNGLQDSETIKRTLEAMKNPENCKGLEYLENLNKKHDKPVSLNGAQDPNDRTPANVPDPQINQPNIKSVSANGLENSRNPNNPLPSRGILRPSRIDEYQELEYPRRRTNVNNRDGFGLIAEKENGSVARTMQQKQRQSHCNVNYSSHNQGTPPALNMHTRSENAFHHWAQMYPEMYENYEKSMANRTVSMPFPLDQNGQHQYDAQQIQQNRENRDKIPDRMNPEHHRTINQSALYSDQIPDNLQQHELPCHLHQPLMIGGVKFLARKPQYAPNSIPMQTYQPNHGNNFNPMIACQ